MLCPCGPVLPDGGDGVLWLRSGQFITDYSGIRRDWPSVGRPHRRSGLVSNPRAHWRLWSNRRTTVDGDPISWSWGAGRVWNWSRHSQWTKVSVIDITNYVIG